VRDLLGTFVVVLLLIRFSLKAIRDMKIPDLNSAKATIIDVAPASSALIQLRLGIRQSSKNVD
jgi:hypothetical protein